MLKASIREKVGLLVGLPMGPLAVFDAVGYEPAPGSVWKFRNAVLKPKTVCADFIFGGGALLVLPWRVRVHLAMIRRLVFGYT